MPKFRFRSAVTGRWVKAWFARIFPFFTVREEVGMSRENFESLKRGLSQAHAHMRGEDVGCVVHQPRERADD